MGKRSKGKSDDEIRKKIRRLERELRYRQVPQPSGRNEDRENHTYYDYQEDLQLDEYATSEVTGCESPPDRELSRESSCEREPPQETPLDPDPAGQTDTPLLYSPYNDTQEVVDKRVKSVVVEAPPSSTPAEVEDVIPIEILEALGVPKQSEEPLGKKIPSEISERLGKILVEGLAKEQKEALLTKLLIPENFQLAKAPKLNAEVTSILADSPKNRDKRLENMQNQLGCGIAGLANLTSELVNNELGKMEIIKRISEVNQILLDLHYEETMNRRRLIIPLLDKSFIKIIQGVKRDKFLFGENLGDNIKTTKSLEKSSLQIKKAIQSQPSSSKKVTGQQLQGNVRAPPRQASGAGPARAPPAQPRYYPPPPPPAPRRPPAQPRRPPPQPLSSSRAYNRNTRR